MATAGEVVNRALSLILVQPSESAIQPDEAASAIEVLNDMMAEWDGLGVSVGYTVASNLSTDITVPPYALHAIKTNLALRLAPEFEGNASQLLAVQADQAYKKLATIVINVEPSEYPCTLPMGSGNTGDDRWDTQFYPCADDEALTETGGTILLETP